MNIGLFELLIILAVPASVFIVGYFVGKGAGFRAGIEYADRNDSQRR